MYAGALDCSVDERASYSRNGVGVITTRLTDA
jgi:hypothetical protein